MQRVQFHGQVLHIGQGGVDARLGVGKNLVERLQRLVQLRPQVGQRAVQVAQSSGQVGPIFFAQHIGGLADRGVKAVEIGIEAFQTCLSVREHGLRRRRRSRRSRRLLST